MSKMPAKSNKPQYAIIIATRKDPELKGTVEHLTEQGHRRILVGEDTNGNGPQFCRHKLIVQAEGADVVLVTDGHMRFRPGAIEALVAHVRACPENVAVARCNHGAPYWAGSLYCGAEQVFHSAEHGNQFWPLPAKWRNVGTTGKIGAAMGACYAFRRDWYMDRLRAPWQYGTGWGYDEEVLSACTRVAGGEIMLLPVDCAHLYQSGPTYQPAPSEALGVWANRLRLVRLLPLTGADREALTRHLRRNDVVGQNWVAIDRLARVPDDALAYWERYRDNCLAWLREWVRPPAALDLDSEVVRREKESGQPRAHNESAAAYLNRVIGGIPAATPAPASVPVAMPPSAAPPPPKARANYAAREKPRACHNCKSEASSVIHVRPQKNGWTNRQRECHQCGKTFWTFEDPA
jgi:hypothetical protein